jgi:aminoglycoside phosphotransferase (APT) family kinase protein
MGITTAARAERQLAAWLAGKLHDAHGIRVVAPRILSDARLSTERIVFDASWVQAGAERRRSFVVRVRPSRGAVLPSYDFDAEFEVLGALGRAGVPVPRALWHERDASLLGGEFIVMERVDGRTPADRPPYTTAGWVVELDTAQQATLFDNGLKALASIHTFDWRAAGLRRLDRRELGTPGLDQQLAYWERCFEWAANGESNATVEAAFEWVRANRPADDEPLSLIWGDARLGNTLFADDMSVTGLVNWEMAALASPELDLGWWLFLLRYHTTGIGARRVRGFPGRGAAVARYEDLTGRDVKHLYFYEVFAGLRLSILTHRAGDLMIRAGILPSNAAIKLVNPASRLLAELLDLPAPVRRVHAGVRPRDRARPPRRPAGHGRLSDEDGAGRFRELTR